MRGEKPSPFLQGAEFSAPKKYYVKPPLGHFRDAQGHFRDAQARNFACLLA
jgi:hypothetical protein